MIALSIAQMADTLLLTGGEFAELIGKDCVRNLISTWSGPNLRSKAAAMSRQIVARTGQALPQKDSR